MSALLVLAGLFFAGLALFSVLVGLVLFFAKAVLWLVLLPFRLLMWAIGVSIAVVIAVLVAVVVSIALLAPLLPFALLGFFVWWLVKMARGPAVAR